MPITVSLLKKLEEVEPRLRGVLVAILEEIERQRAETVTKIEFNELKEIVRDLADAQKELAEAQRDLTNAQRALADAQKETEKGLHGLSGIVQELAEAQKRTEKELHDLVKDHSKTREQVGGLSNTVGYVLENEAYKFLPTLLEQEFGLKLKGRLLRDFVKDKKGKSIEVNILGEAVKNGSKYIIIGESKAQLSKNKVSEFYTKKVDRLIGVFAGELFPILVTHMKAEPDVDEFALQRGVKRVYYSYEFGH
jgi:DNA repair exonuclease SbcCD ATPase subunit